MVIADVTDKNANVNYELGLCHSVGVPTILITKRMEDVPFDYRHRRCIVYNTDEAGWEQKLGEALRRTINTVMNEGSTEEDLVWPYDTALVNEPSARSPIIITGNPRDIVIQGTQIVKKHIGRAFGPAGTLFSYSVGNREPMPYKQGSSIVQGIRSTNPLEQRGIREMQVVAQEVSHLTGDGTKLGILIAQALIELGNEALKRDLFVRDFIRGMNGVVDFVQSELRKFGDRPLKGKQVAQVAATAAMDSSLGQIIAEAMSNVGKDGVITVEDSGSTETELVVVEGMEFDRGYLHPHFITNAESEEVILENPYILIHERKILSVKDLLPLLEQIAKQGQALFIMAEDVEGEALQTLVLNKLRGTLKVAAVKAPGYGDRRDAVMEDIAILTGGKVVSENVGLTLANITLEELGRAKGVKVSRDTTTIVEGAGDMVEIKARIKAMRMRIEETISPYDREKIQERLARLVGAVAVIRIGGVSDVNVLDKRYRCISGMHAARAAVESGWVPGGGAALFHISKSLRERSSDNEAVAAALDIGAQALELPIYNLIENAQASPTLALHEISQRGQVTVGFNAESGRVEDLVETGVIDPVKMLSIAIEVAFDHAKFVLQTSEWDLDYNENNAVGH